jgi:hypothetical protein
MPDAWECGYPSQHFTTKHNILNNSVTPCPPCEVFSSSRNDGYRPSEGETVRFEFETCPAPPNAERQTPNGGEVEGRTRNAPRLSVPSCEINNDTGIEEGKLDFYRRDTPADVLA